MRARVVCSVVVLVAASCGRGGGGAPSATSSASGVASAAAPSGSAVTTTSTGPADPGAVLASPSGAPSASAAPVGSAANYPGETRGCPAGMLRVEGEYCPALTQRCEEHHQEYSRNKQDKNVSERCLRYAPSKCVSKEKRRLSFCMDRFEWPNREGEQPRVFTSWRAAKKLCEGAGRRLCTEDEFNFACEGPEMLPYTYGLVRDASKCNIDKEYRYPDRSRQWPQYDKCLEEPECQAELARLDQRHRIAERLSCTSWAGAYDLNGNVNEWVELPGKEPPHRSGLKGGWWGPVRNRCRPTVTFHKEEDYGYEAGFRCCAEAQP